MPKITVDELKALLDYNPTTGDLTWKRRRVIKGPAYYSTKWFNTSTAGTVAGSAHITGVRVRVNGTDYLGHRIAWALLHGVWPKDQIQHINGNNKDNRECNIRLRLYH